MSQRRYIWHLGRLLKSPKLLKYYLMMAWKSCFSKQARVYAQDSNSKKIEQLDLWHSTNLFPGITQNNDPDSVDWIIPDFSAFSGGHRTVSRMAKSLELKGIRSNFILLNAYTPQDLISQHELIREVFSLSNYSVISVRDVSTYSPVSIATSWESSLVQENYPSKNKCYFIQDAENMFSPANSIGAMALWTYRLPSHKIILGNWLARQIQNLGSEPSLVLNFGTTFISETLETETNSLSTQVVFYVQHSKDRRGTELLMQSINLLAKAYPDLEIVILGENIHQIHDLPNSVNYVGAVPEEELLSYFRPNNIGVVISHSNPSLIPFEMISRGMIVCTNGEYTNLLDLNFPEVIFFPPFPSDILIAVEDSLKRLGKQNRNITKTNVPHWDQVTNHFAIYIKDLLRK